VTLVIIPRVAGTLDILGVRWQLQVGTVSVSAFHMFATLGTG